MSAMRLHRHGPQRSDEDITNVTVTLGLKMEEYLQMPYEVAWSLASFSNGPENSRVQKLTPQMWVKFGQNTEAAPAWTGVITLVPRSSRGSSPVGIGFTNPEGCFFSPTC